MSTGKSDDEYAIAVAKLRSDGLLQAQIAKRLGISQPEVSRHLRRARDRKWLNPNPQFSCPDQDLLKRAEARFLSTSDICDALKALAPRDQALRKVTLVHTDSNGRLGSSVVELFQELLSNVKSAGVTWGRTVRRLVETFSEHSSLLRRTSPIQFVPLCGEPLRDRTDLLKYSSSAIAAELAAIFNGREHKHISIAGVPAFIPREFTDNEVQTILRFIHHVAGYGDVFSTHDSNRPLVDELDAVITSVGFAGKVHRGIFLTERLELGDLTEKELEQCVVGDIGGIMLTHPDVTKKQADLIRKLNQRWLGVNQQHLEHCVRSAVEGNKPGVILLAFGKDRLDMVKRCVELNLVNELIVDALLAEELRKPHGLP